MLTTINLNMLPVSEPATQTIALPIRKQERVANGKSVTNLMSLAALPGTVLELEVAGEDAQIALPILAEALAALSSEALERLLK